MNTLLSVIPVVMRRTAANARLLLAVIAGAILAAALMSTTSIYTDAIRDLGLSYALRQEGQVRLNPLIRLSSQSSQPDVYKRNQEFIENTARQTLGPILSREITTIARSATFYPTPPGAPVSPSEERPRSHLQFLTDLEEHVRVTEGRLPRTTALPAAGRAPQIEVALGGETARAFGLRVGDRFDLHPFWQADAEPVQATIVGILDPRDLSEPYWAGQTDIFLFPSGRWQTYPFFVTPETFLETVAGYLPTMSSDYLNVVYVSTGKIDARNADSVREAVLAFDRTLQSNIVRATTTTELPRVLETYDQKLLFTRIPLLVLVIQIASIVLYYLFMVSTMLVERQSGEIALLKSRGATTAQVMQIYAIEGLVVLLLALGLGPPLAAVVISLLGHTPPFADLSGGSSLSVRLTLDAYLWASAGAVLAYVTLLWPAYLTTRHTVVQQRTLSSRPPKQPPFLRYYLDVGLVGVLAILFYQLNRRGTLVSERLFGEQSADPIMLLTPAFFILTVGILFLRLFPLALRVLAWFVARAQGAAVLIGMWQLVRNPVHYSRLVLLLMLATAVGMFAASFGTTINKSYEDRAAYQAGAELRVSAIRRAEASGPGELAGTLQQRTGATAASPVLRTTGSHGQLISRVGFDILGVDPATFAAVAYFRDDFAGPSLGSLMEVLKRDGPVENDGIELPADARWLGVWMNPTDLRGRVGLDVEVRDAAGRYYSYILGPDSGAEFTPGWAFLVADLSRPSPGGFGAPVQFEGAAPQTPLTILSLNVRFVTRVGVPSGSVQLDQLQVTSEPDLPAVLARDRLLLDPARSSQPFAQARVVAPMDAASEWEPIQTFLPERMPDEVRVVPSPGGQALEFAWRPPASGQPSTHGLKPRTEERPLRVLASEAFLRQSNLQIGDEVRAFVSGNFIDMRIDGSYRLFPTLPDPRRQPSVVANGARLAQMLNLNPRSSIVYPDEVWLTAPPGAARELRRDLDRGRLIANITSFEELRLAQEEDPLVAAGWEGILFLSFAAILLLSAVGFLIYSYLTAQKRTLEFAVLRTMGFSKAQIATVVGFEQFFVIGLGMLAGSLMGLRLGSLMIRYMGVTETGDEVLPPMLLHVSWFTAGSALLVLGAVFLVTIGIVVLLYSRLALHRVLRIGEA